MPIRTAAITPTRPAISRGAYPGRGRERRGIWDLQRQKLTWSAKTGLPGQRRSNPSLALSWCWTPAEHPHAIGPTANSTHLHSGAKVVMAAPHDEGWAPVPA